MSSLLWCILLLLPNFFTGCLAHNQGLDIQVLNVGEELTRQIIPLKMGQCIYSVYGLKQSLWYEVKISYPASIPASFSLQVKGSARDLWLNKNRRLLNTEKLIFKHDSNTQDSAHNNMYVLVTVQHTGVVAKPGAEEREFVLFNIVCDELSLGIPHKAWWVGAAAILCLILASVVPYFLPLQQMLKIQTSQSIYSFETKVTWNTSGITPISKSSILKVKLHCDFGPSFLMQAILYLLEFMTMIGAYGQRGRNIKPNLKNAYM